MQADHGVAAAHIPPEALAFINGICHERGITRSELILECIISHIPAIKEYLDGK